MAKEKLENLCGLFLKQGEKQRLYEICLNHSIPIKYPDLFNNDNHYYFWGIRHKGVGLISIVIMNYLNDNNCTIFHSLDELEEYLNKN